MSGIGSMFSGLSSSGLMSGLGSIATGFAQSRAQENAGDARAQAYEYNAAVARSNAAAAMQAAEADAKQQARENARRLGTLRTGLVAQGVEMTGTPLLILDEEVQQGELETQKKLYKGKIQQTNYLNEANMADYAASQSRSAASNSAGSSLLSGFSKGFSSFGKL